MIAKRGWWALLLSSWLMLSPLSAKEELASPFANDEIFKEFQKLHEEMNSIFEKFDQKFFKEEMKGQLFSDFPTSSVRADIKDKKSYYEVKVDLPGSKDTNINVKVTGNLLEIDARVEKEEEKKGEHYLQKERIFSSFHRSLTLPKDADSDKLKSDYKEGVLTITIPKKR